MKLKRIPYQLWPTDLQVLADKIRDTWTMAGALRIFEAFTLEYSDYHYYMDTTEDKCEVIVLQAY